MAKYGNISIYSVIEDYIDFSGHQGELDEVWVLKQADDAVSRIVTDQQLDHRIVILDVKDYKAQLPNHFRYVVQAAYRLAPQAPCLVEQVSQFTQDILGTDCELEINLKCSGCHKENCTCDDRNVLEVDVNRIYETAHPELFSKYMGHFYTYGGNTGRGYQSIYSQYFHLMRKTSNSFFNIPYHIDECINLSLDCNIEYDIKHPNIVVNFKEGEILLSYLGTQVDEDGYRMIPNDPQVFKAINYWIHERMRFIQYNRTGEQKDRIFWQQMVEMAEKQISRAKSQLQIPSEDEWWQFIQNHWRKVLPNYHWEENFNRGMPDQFRYPDQTYNHKGYLSPRTGRRNRY